MDNYHGQSENNCYTWRQASLSSGRHGPQKQYFFLLMFPISVEVMCMSPRVIPGFQDSHWLFKKVPFRFIVCSFIFCRYSENR